MPEDQPFPNREVGTRARTPIRGRWAARIGCSKITSMRNILANVHQTHWSAALPMSMTFMDRLQPLFVGR
jgi:hypothetical protein